MLAYTSRGLIAQRLVIDPQAMLHVGPVVFDQHVRAFCQPHQDLASFRVLEVERHAALVAMQVLEVKVMARTDFGRIVVRRFDLQHLGAPVRQLTHCGRSRSRAREVDYFETCQRKFVHNCTNSLNKV